MYIKSPYPDPPAIPETNAHRVYFKRADQADWSDYPAHIDAETDERVMYRELVSQIEALSTGLATPVSEGGLGITTSEMVAIIGENSSEYISLIHACIRLATTFVPISSYGTPFELNHAFIVSKPTRLFVDEKLLGNLLPVAKKAGLEDDRIYILKTRQSGKEVKGRKGCNSIIDEVRRKNVKTVEVGFATRNTIAYLIFSSGTTGLSKAVRISHGNLVFATAQFMVYAQVSATVSPPSASIPISLAFLPLHHSYGLHSYCFSPCLSPSTLVILPQWNIKLVLRLIPKYRVTSLNMIPSHIHQLVNHPGIEKVDLSSLDRMIYGASYLPLELQLKMKKLLRINVRFVEGYGMSEATVISIVQPLDGSLNGKLKFIPGSTGVLFPGVEGRIVREDGTEAGVNETGELWLRSGNIFVGYLNNEKANREAFQEGWLRTGDYFRVDENGYFWFSDRVKDTLKVSGAQVSPMEIENCLLSQPDKLIIDAVVAGVSGGRTSDERIPCSWVVLSPAGKKLGRDKVIKILDAWQKKNLSSYKHLRGGIEIVNEIPKSPTGKILRRVLQDKYEAELKNTSKSKL